MARLGISKRELSEIETRLLERRKTLRRALLLKLTKWLSICLGLTILTWGLLFSPLFKVSEIEVHGLDGNPNAIFVDNSTFTDLLNSCTSQSASSLVAFSTDNFEEQLANVDGVKESSVAKAWPNKLIITVSLRTPVAHEGPDLTDAEGKTLHIQASQIAGQTDEEKSAFLAAQLAKYPEMVLAPEARGDGLALLKVIEKEPQFAPGIKKIVSTSRDDISVILNNGVIIIFGNTNRLTLKLEVLSQMLATDLGGRRTIDLSSPTDPVAR